ncbi:response regulator transcription factor [Pararhodobacter marinus]|uniref:response regulator transcription factor n=1 Tax=Pararhodobacter marinus TaxID=2184063 RepID=UPI003515B9DA
MGHGGPDQASGDDSPFRAQGQAGPRSGEDAKRGAGRRVLVVEDEPNISEAIRFILSRDGWQVEMIGTGEGALDRIAAGEPDVVILDVMLPDLSGYDVLRTLRVRPCTARLPVIVLTARGTAAARETARDAGASVFMAKPFVNSELLSVVRQLAGA